MKPGVAGGLMLALLLLLGCCGRLHRIADALRGRCGLGGLFLLLAAVGDALTAEN